MGRPAPEDVERALAELLARQRGTAARVSPSMVLKALGVREACAALRYAVALRMERLLAVEAGGRLWLLARCERRRSNGKKRGVWFYYVSVTPKR